MPNHMINLFPIVNLRQLTSTFRWFEVTGLPSGETLDTQFNLLTKQLAYQLREPVAPVRRDGRLFVALPDRVEPILEQQLTPHVATLIPDAHASTLRFDALTPETTQVAIAFLNYAIRTPLMHHNNLWGNFRTFFLKRPLNERDRQRTIDIVPGFIYTIIVREGAAWLAIDLTTKYVDTSVVSEQFSGNQFEDIRHRHALYHYGHRWFRVQILGTTGKSVAQQQFIDSTTARAWTVYDYTHANCDQRSLANYPLTPDSPALRYRYPGNAQERYGAAALCRLLYPTGDPRVQQLHHRSIVEPQPRFEEISDIVQEFFSHATLGDTPIQVVSEPMTVSKRCFAVPDMQLGHDQVLHVKRDQHDVGVALSDLGRTRQRMLLDPAIGMLQTTSFATQYLLVPQSLHRELVRQFQRDLETAVSQMASHPYRTQLVVYDDRHASSLFQQWKAVKHAIEQNHINRGYGVIILPPRMDAQLHHLLKRQLWSRFQFQCVTSSQITTFYRMHDHQGQQQAMIRPELRHRFTTYLRYVVCGILTVNRMWPWALATPLHYDAYVGVDVLNHEVGCTFVYRNGHDILFDNFHIRQTEKIPRQQAEHILSETVAQHIRDRQLQLRSLIVHRDGRSFDSELLGWRRGFQRLQAQHLLTADAQVGVVDIRKTSALPLRIVERRNDGSLYNPQIGAHFILPGDQGDGIVCTTGQPFAIPGTAKPLHAVIADGHLDATWVLEDVFALSHLIFAAPDRCGRLPITIKLADDFLEPIAAAYDEERALYEDSFDDIETEDEDTTAELLDIALS